MNQSLRKQATKLLHNYTSFVSPAPITMCYDMSFFASLQVVADELKIKETPPEHFTPTWHQVAQSYTQWPVVINDDGYRIRLFEWGLMAPYMNTPEKIKQYRSSMANARSEKILGDKLSVWHRLRNQRCLVCTTGFFEHHDAGLKKKIPFFIRLRGQSVFFIAGLYNYSPIPEPATGELTGSFSVITRPGNTLMQAIHNSGSHPNRMPLILSKELANTWLSNNLGDNEIGELLRYEYPENLMEAWPVKPIRVQKEDGPVVIEKEEYKVALPTS